MFSISFSKEADKFFSRLNKFDQQRIAKRIEMLKESPFSISKKLVGNELWSLRVGKDFRVIFRASKYEIEVVAIGYRRNIYGNL